MKKLIILAALALLPLAARAGQTVAINSLFGDGKPWVYDLGADNAAGNTLSYIKSLHDQFAPKAELLDAKHLDASAEQKLSRGFILYAVPGMQSRLLEKAGEPFGLKISSGDITFNGRSYAGDKLQLIFAGKNPYGGAPISAYAAKDNTTLEGINDHFHGPKSCYVFDAGKELLAGDYDGELVGLYSYITADKALADAEQFFSDAQRIHPDIYANIGKGGFAKLHAATIKEIKKSSDKAGHVDKKALVSILSYAAARFGDGHTGIFYYPDQDVYYAAVYPPFTLAARDGRFFVENAVDKELIGMELTKMEGKPVDRFIKPVLDRCPAETAAFRATSFAGKQAYWWAFSGLLKGRTTISATFIGNKNALKKDLKVANYQDFYRLGKSTNKPPLETKFLEGGKVAYLAYHQLPDDQTLDREVADFFSLVKDIGSKALVIDLRGDTGGDSRRIDLLFNFIHSGPYRMNSGCDFKVTPESRREKRMGQPGQDGQVLKFNYEEQKSSNPENFFTGKVWLLTDNDTYSSANMFTAAFKAYNAGEIIGLETGDPAKQYGDPVWLQLPNSGIGYGVSTKLWYAPKPAPGDDKHGVFPDVHITGELLAPFAAEKDPVLSFTLARIKNTLK